MQKIVCIFLLIITHVTYPALPNLLSASIVVQQDGTFLLASGALQSGVLTSFVMNYTTQGWLNSSFGTTNNGIVSLSSTSSFLPAAIGVQSTERILVAGYGVINGITQPTIIGLLSTGAYDSSFGQSGSVSLSTSSGGCSFDIEILSDDSIIQAGAIIANGVSNFSMAKYTADGTLDTTFGDSGQIIQSMGDSSTAYSIAIQSDDAIVVAGSATISGSTQIALCRYTSAGILDTTFGTDGIVIQAIGTNTSANVAILDSEGNIIVGGNSDSNFFICRFTSAGVLDTTFATGGIITRALGAQNTINSLLLQSSDSIVAVGVVNGFTFLTRYTSSGLLDTTFGTNGTVVLNQLPITNSIGSAIINDTNIIVGAFWNTNMVLINFTSNGLFNQSWGIQGIGGMFNNAPLNNSTLIYELESQGASGGTFNSGSWQTRILNSIINGTPNFSLLNNQLLMQPGVYLIHASAPAYKTNSHQIRLYNVTDGIVVGYGTSACSDSNGVTTSRSELYVPLFVSTPTAFEIQHQCQSTELNDGFGLACNFGDEIYTQVLVTQKV